MAKKVHSAESNRSDLVPEGMYVLELTGVTVSQRPDRNGNNYWIWAFKVADGDHKGAKLRNNTGFADDQLWSVKAMFDAFEVKPNVNTDDLIGKQIRASVDQHEITSGARKGQLANGIVDVMPAGSGADDGDDWDADDKDGDDKDEPDF